jgi:serine/threonine protein kinase
MDSTAFNRTTKFANRTDVHGLGFSQLSLNLNKKRMKSPLSKAQMKMWEPVTKDGQYSIQKIIGKGSFGIVAKAYDVRNQRYVAIKKLDKFSRSEYSSVQLVREIKLLKEFRKHPDGAKYVPVLYDVIGDGEFEKDFSDPNKSFAVFIVMEYFPTDLKKLIESDLRFLSARKITQMIQDALNALRFIHSCNVVHRDIKPANIFLTSDF